ncbi:trypsin-like peptidase domain-containing protein [Polaromonas sp. CT11-55]|uniref:trypsin-like peptidase domain-containing protein n=1 Tax=Polaromonas sp. CT11-55 TaxID=3243045 RepID=UPI0039A46849
MDKDEVSTVAQTNPEIDLRIGETLNFDPRRLLFQGSNGDYMPVGSQLGILLALSFRDDLGHHTTGSAAMVGPGLAICAAHVLEDQGYLEKLARGDATLVAQAPLPGGMLLWTVLRVATVPQTDLAVLSLTLSSSFPADRHFSVASITTRMPAIGDVLTVTGLSAARRTEERSNSTRIEMVPGCVLGPVIDRYPDGRDRSMLPGPCLAVECEARGGMSGGPVFDSRGYLVGVVSSSYEGDTTTFVSHIWPALIRAHVCPVWPGPPYPLPPPGSLLQLGLKFGISIERPNAFEVCAPNNEVALRYVAWE